MLAHEVHMGLRTSCLKRHWPLSCPLDYIPGPKHISVIGLGYHLHCQPDSLFRVWDYRL